MKKKCNCAEQYYDVKPCGRDAEISMVYKTHNGATETISVSVQCAIEQHTSDKRYHQLGRRGHDALSCDPTLVVGRTRPYVFHADEAAVWFVDIDGRERTSSWRVLRNTPTLAKVLNEARRFARNLCRERVECGELYASPIAPVGGVSVSQCESKWAQSVEADFGYSGSAAVIGQCRVVHLDPDQVEEVSRG